MKPSNFTAHPYNSVKRKSESETVAANIMRILKRTGNTFRNLNWDEYKAERLNDDNFSEKEHAYFLDVIGFCASAETAVLFSPAWVQEEESPHDSPHEMDGISSYVGDHIY